MVLAPLVIAVMLAVGSPVAHAEAGFTVFNLNFGKSPRLLPTLHATEVLDAAQENREYDYVAKGYFKVAGKTVARLPTFKGHADANRQHLALTVKRSTRSTIRAAAKHRGVHRVTLTLIYRLVLTTRIPGDQTPITQTAKQYADLTIPRN
jgi:hypothetical protein